MPWTLVSPQTLGSHSCEFILQNQNGGLKNDGNTGPSCLDKAVCRGEGGYCHKGLSDYVGWYCFLS